MGWMRGQWLRFGIMGLALSWAFAGVARAEVSTERSASILIFPKIIFDSTFDTSIQISNTSNSIVYGHCFYVDASLTFPELPPGPNNPPQWQEVDFDIVLTKQQPTHWVISRGRVNNPFDPACALQGICVGGSNPGAVCPAGSGLGSTDCVGGGFCSNTNCNDAGFDPGRIPPVSPGFTGELKCIEVDQSGAPISGNHLKGEATLISLVNSPFSKINDASKYNAIGIIGLDTNDSNNKLCLGGGATADCPAGAEYEGCPDSVLVSHYAEGAADPVSFEFGNPSSVVSQLTLVPCREDFETQTPTSVVVQFLTYNEFETRSSTSTTVTCWSNFNLGSLALFTVQTQLSRYLQTYMRPASDDSGFVGVLEEFHTQVGAGTSRSAENLTVVGQRATTDLITIPEGP